MLKILEIIDVDAQTVTRVIHAEETHFVDVKAIELAPAKLAIHGCAFANGAGGEIYVGIDDPSSGSRGWRGFTLIEDANGHIQVLN